MKIVAILFLLMFSLAGYGQSNAKTKPNSEWQPLWYLDSVNVSAAQLGYINPNNIERVDAVKGYRDSVNKVEGKIYIKTKGLKKLDFLTIFDIVKSSGTDSKAPIVFMVDNEFLMDTTGLKIDSSYILRTEIIKASEIDYLKNAFPNLTILKIFTRTKENLDKLEEKSKIRIRGMKATASKITKLTEYSTSPRLE